ALKGFHMQLQKLLVEEKEPEIHADLLLLTEGTSSPIPAQLRLPPRLFLPTTAHTLPAMWRQCPAVLGPVVAAADPFWSRGVLRPLLSPTASEQAAAALSFHELRARVEA